MCEDFRTDKGSALPSWLDWCFLPLPAMYPISRTLASSGTDAARAAPAATGAGLRAVVEPLEVEQTHQPGDGTLPGPTEGQRRFSLQ